MSKRFRLKNIFHFKNYSFVDDSIKIDIKYDRFSEQFQKAQKELDVAVMNSMLPLIPLQNGDLRRNTRALSVVWAGSGKVYAAKGPYGRFQYMGKVMIDPVTKSPWARKDAKKIVTARPLKYSQPGIVPQWFDVAKKRDGKIWVEKTKKTAGGG